MREAQKRTESQLNHLAELMQKFANQPLPNPKGGINTVQVEIDIEGEDEAEDEEGENDRLYELLAELANSDESDDEEEHESIKKESEEESDEEKEESELAEEEDIDDRDKGKIFFINTLFKEKKSKEEIPIKLGMAEDVLVKIGQLTIPVDLHVIMPTKGDKGGRPQVLLGRPFLKMAEFKLIYYNVILTFSIGNTIEIFHFTLPPNLKRMVYTSCRRARDRRLQGKRRKLEQK
ncbi:hypothetical protein PIB30_075695 [Stylosanthes scabra]|uniref:Uncharacterized protein n=1 Tax=Stylosanthes scabra TaxID=79078 RepID=A0ABU6UQ09_9FABA|nr:hypothetical protein [Stylosanthes scabra]